ncbi:MAG TPA: hypothetical protein VLA36_04105 [Longimicrobiales bacterium]|nr:hypothetical protein [Longimicrobiales bacterium]
MRRALFLVTAVATLAACAESPTQVVDTTPLFTITSAGPVVATATGSGHALCGDDGAFCYSTDEDRALRTFTFTAQVREDGSTRGKAEFNNRGRDQAWHADIECVYFRPDKPNQAWIAGTLTRGYGQAPAPSGIPYAAGARVLFAVEDNGQGGTATAPDRIMGFGTIPEAQYQAVCNFPEVFPSAQLEFFMQLFGFNPIRGDIQVRPPSAD